MARAPQPKQKPLLVYDGECGFCRHWVEKWRRLTGERISYAPYQEAAARFPQVPQEEFAAALKLIMPDGRVYSGAEAVFRSLAHAGKRRWLLWSYEHLPGFRPMADAAYRFVANHRPLFSALTLRKYR